MILVIILKIKFSLFGFSAHQSQIISFKLIQKPVAITTLTIAELDL
jgi:hypothetical protein